MKIKISKRTTSFFLVLSGCRPLCSDGQTEKEKEREKVMRTLFSVSKSVTHFSLWSDRFIGAHIN